MPPAGIPIQARADLVQLFRSGSWANLSDGQLLERFADRGGASAEDAFAMLVERHGPMVLGTCRRILNHAQEAEDAFQATFLVLARKASALPRQESLAAWLHVVAVRTARNARSRLLRSKQREAEVGAYDAAGRNSDELAAELRPLLDEELARLPERYRAAVLLCELEGLSRQQAAIRLGIPEGTLSSRLARAKNLLRDRLARRGMGVPALLLTTVLGGESTAAVVTAAMAQSTIQAATRVAAGSSAAGLISASVSSLTEEVLTAMFFAKIKSLGLGLAALGFVVYGAFATGAIAVAQDRAEPELSRTARIQSTRDRADDADRLRSLEQKIDRLIETLGQPGAAFTASPLGQPGAASTASPRGTAAPPPPSILPAPPTRQGQTPENATLNQPVRSPSARGVAEDRLGALERRLADIERRLQQIERRIPADGTISSPAAVSPAASSDSLPALAPGGESVSP